MDRHTENPIMGNTKSQHYNRLVKRIARHKQFGIPILHELIDELAKSDKVLKAKTNVESNSMNGKIARVKALWIIFSIQEGKAVSKTIEVNSDWSSKIFCIRKLSSKVKSTAHPKAEPGVQKVNARMANTGLAGFMADNVIKKDITNVEVNMKKEMHTENPRRAIPRADTNGISIKHLNDVGWCVIIFLQLKLTWSTHYVWKYPERGVAYCKQTHVMSAEANIIPETEVLNEILVAMKGMASLIKKKTRLRRTWPKRPRKGATAGNN